jgi:hypothetical protein
MANPKWRKLDDAAASAAGCNAGSNRSALRTITVPSGYDCAVAGSKPKCVA